MRVIIIAVLILVSCQLVVGQTPGPFKTIDLSTQTFEGRGWNSGLKNNYDRFPARAEQTVRKEVWNLSENGAGLYLRFQTNAAEIVIKYTVTGARQMNHMPATGVSGVDLYSRSKAGQWSWSAAKYSFGDTVVYRYTNLNKEDGREYTLYLPLYNHVSWMEIGYPADAMFTFAEASKQKPIVIYGTSIAQGGCASRPGLAWTNILGRKIQSPVINLAFSGNGRMEKEVFELISEVDAGLYVLDCLPNMAGPSYVNGELKKRLLEGIGFLQSHKPGVPILLTDHCGYTDELTNDVSKNSYQAANKIQLAVYDSLKAAGVKNLYYLTKNEIGLNIESTVDGIHPNDIGMMQYAEAYFKKLRKILKER
ncbi:MAG TPA: SGNH/GDSL hydrolase family protein [Chitinophagaceae bacterium]|nr:SGNH/GDSL hydrolase family protein [Chitinophagaceae bacterium]